jgi:radical SAM superfamily enzyme YgiQ (UPF0313 family)
VIIPAFPSFNIYSQIARVTTALGPLCVATVANKIDGWDAEVVDENNYRKFGPRTAAGLPDHEALQRLRPADVVGFYGGLTSTSPRLYELARFYRQRGVVTVAGGQHFVGDNLQEGLDNGVQFIVIGEGEATIHELLQAIQAGREPDHVAGLAFRRNGELVQTPAREPLTDFDLLPVPDFGLLRYAQLKLYPVAWVRGCGMNCEFCTVKGKVRCPAPEFVMDQITSLLEKHNARHFFVVDDLFGQHRAEALKLCELLRAYQETVGTRLDFTVQIRLDKAKDVELLRAMRRAGVNSVAIGFESPIPEELEAMDKRVRPEEMVALSRVYQQAGFLVHGMFIFGYPIPGAANLSLSVENRVRRFRRFIRDARIDTVQVLLPVPLPGTEMTARLAAQNRIYPRDLVGWEYYDGNFPVFEPDPPLTAEQVQGAIRQIMGRFYRFRYMFVMGLNILVFPALVFSLHNLKRGWRRWYRSWRNSLRRFGGWTIMRKWKAEFDKGTFSAKLRQAHAAIRSRPSPGA